MPHSGFGIPSNAVANMGSGSGIPQVKELWEVRCVRLEDFDASVAANFHQSTLRPQAVILGERRPTCITRLVIEGWRSGGTPANAQTALWALANSMKVE